jgi:hypothetical protein
MWIWELVDDLVITEILFEEDTQVLHRRASRQYAICCSVFVHLDVTIFDGELASLRASTMVITASQRGHRAVASISSDRYKQ